VYYYDLSSKIICPKMWAKLLQISVSHTQCNLQSFDACGKFMKKSNIMTSLRILALPFINSPELSTEGTLGLEAPIQLRYRDSILPISYNWGV
jgi:hypothetical protein